MTTARDLEAIFHEHTGGKEFIFVVLACDAEGHVDNSGFWAVVQDVARDLGLGCVRLDDLHYAAEFPDAIHFGIERAEVVVVEASHPRPNVYYEMGYARARGKLVVVCAVEGADIHSDIQSFKRIEYVRDHHRLKAFKEELKESIRRQLDTERTILRTMLSSGSAFPSYIVRGMGDNWGQPTPTSGIHNLRTFGDNLGIRGLLTAFGVMFGQTQQPELLLAHQTPEELLGVDCNLYLIGSKKVNAAAASVMASLQCDLDVRWEFRDKYTPENAADRPPVDLWRISKEREDCFAATSVGQEADLRWVHDYGVIVRGPHPHRPHRLAMVMAGAHALGSGAACMAATEATVIRKVRASVGNQRLADYSRPLWVIVEAHASDTDGLLDPDAVSVVDWGPC